jgi:hypothetical protein
VSESGSIFFGESWNVKTNFSFEWEKLFFLKEWKKGSSVLDVYNTLMTSALA